MTFLYENPSKLIKIKNTDIFIDLLIYIFCAKQCTPQLISFSMNIPACCNYEDWNFPCSEL